MTKAGVLLAGLLVALSTIAPSAAAATRTVHLTDNGPSPAALTLRPGDRVAFVNDDVVPHEVTSQSGWQYDSGPVPPGRTSPATPALTAPGTYRYVDSRGVVFLPQNFSGRLVIPAARPQPSTTPSHHPSPRPTTSPTPSTASPSPATPSASPSASPTASPAPTSSLAPRSSPTPTVVPTELPTPPTPRPDLRYGDPKAIAQTSPHRYGLPALLAGVAIGGVLSLLGRYLLSLPDGRRTGSG